MLKIPQWWFAQDQDLQSFCCLLQVGAKTYPQKILIKNCLRPAGTCYYNELELSKSWKRKWQVKLKRWKQTTRNSTKVSRYSKKTTRNSTKVSWYSKKTTRNSTKVSRCSLKEDNAKFTKNITVIKQNTAKLAKDIAVLKQDNAKLQEDDAKLTKDITVLKQDNAKLTKDIAVLKQDNEKLQEDDAKLTKVLKHDNAKLQHQFDTLRIDVENLSLKSSHLAMEKERKNWRTERLSQQQKNPTRRTNFKNFNYRQACHPRACSKKNKMREPVCIVSSQVRQLSQWTVNSPMDLRITANTRLGQVQEIGGQE
eukprot:TRINITY_DN1430_c0_g1_i8.p1 TRINITY_DN1430_c0_g1~~TRINITY_DN1430_c0_g1_i8.p1  ORF type:complete len:310 (+),score=25.16 TRINITY_DN1430_c0_g1_i8:890-1819(+)